MRTNPPHGIMLVAGETSGDLLGAELVSALRRSPGWQAWPHEPRVFGAGGPLMRAAGVDIALDLTRHAVVGLAEVVRRALEFRRLLQSLVDLACARQPDLLVGIDFSAFNRRLVRALRRRLAAQTGVFHNWRPRFVQYVSPQVWASRPRRAYGLARDYDLLLCLFSFEKEWYARRVPKLAVEWVGHPLLDRHATRLARPRASPPASPSDPPTILLLPGSRVGELQAHLPVLLGAVERLRAGLRARFQLVLPNPGLRPLAERLGARDGPDFAVQVGGLAEALDGATVAIASTGTVTLECALYGVPTVTFYKTSWTTYQFAKRLVTVAYAAMPNLLANAPVFPEFIQHAATPDNLADAARALLTDPARRNQIGQRLAQVVGSLGGPGASDRAAAAILGILNSPPRRRLSMGRDAPHDFLAPMGADL
ncbi:MAG: lipid-A-disaccharide synthase [Verrucomicrobia bacterium]|nr:lipid-A-disaccharide synthase [Verrucomicrobiota bacterium]OQC68064.1 MAG: Lipid-A-disaccharide synthase [Verrucomicrobia bacterium ADurb.Bin006]MDI9379352.1 lipid-A-disaccharide synthase [Verrucomicrobiota bacterium]NMD19004.1 lipid-A-disaccharide synthase [Verrucomicrobiota bacterium]HNU99635.1 lipid-A-disaccharide synthase [Verrucomicrobiota bacterium]